MKKKINGLLNLMTTIFVISILSFAGLNFLSQPGKEGLFGYKGYIVLSDSMKPTFAAGDYIIDQVVSYEKVKEKDVVSYFDYEQGVVVTHRVVEKGEEGLYLQGDGNNFVDRTLVTKENYIGTYQYAIPKLGSLMLSLSQPIVIVAVSVFFLAIVLYQSLKKKTPVKQKS